jgi:hypothetical protein
MYHHEIIVSSKPIDHTFQKIIIDRCIQSISTNTVITNETPFHGHSIPDVTVPQYLDRYIVF